MTNYAFITRIVAHEATLLDAGGRAPQPSVFDRPPRRGRYRTTVMCGQSNFGPVPYRRQGSDGADEMVLMRGIEPPTY